MQCPTCQRTWPDEFKVCPTCGITLKAEMGEGASGAIAQAGGVASGSRGVAVGGDVEGGIRIHYHIPEVPALQVPIRIFHNLPQPDYVRFVGREDELSRIRELLSPANRAWIIVIDGIGGIGKSALALEVAHRYLRDYSRLPGEECFEAIIWVSAKETTLTGNGIVPRQHAIRKLDNIYTAISIALDREEISRARPEERDAVVRRALTRQRTLLIIDNLETIDDRQVNEFLHELPAPTKCIVTTRHRIDVAYPVRLTGMSKEEGQALIAQECVKKDVTLNENEAKVLYERTGGVPLAIVWSVAQMGAGHRAEVVLNRLGQPTGDIARFCFEEAVDRICDTDAKKLLMALSLFATSASRDALGYVADLDADVLSWDEELALLEKLSLINRGRSGRFWMLPLTREYVVATLLSGSATAIELRNRQVEYYLKYIPRPASIQPYSTEIVAQVKNEVHNVLDLLEWCKDQGEQHYLLELFLRIHHLLGVFGYLSTREYWGHHAIQAAKVPGVTAHLGILYVAMGWLYIKRGDLARARRYLERGITFSRQNNDCEAEYLAMRYLGRLDSLEGDAVRALQTYLNALTMAMAGGYEAVVAGINADLSYWHMQHGTLEEAEKHVKAAIDGFEELNDIVRASDRTIMLANILVRQGKFSEAEKYLLPSLQHLEKDLRQPEAVAAGYACLAHICAEQGNRVEAIKCCNRAEQIYDRIGMREETFPIGLPEICDSEDEVINEAATF